MNCDQFEKRAQQLLDNRSNVRLDIALQHHARECSDCRMALSIYDCFATLSGGESRPEAVLTPIAVEGRSSVQYNWQTRQKNSLRNRT